MKYAQLPVFQYQTFDRPNLTIHNRPLSIPASPWQQYNEYSEDDYVDEPRYADDPDPQHPESEPLVLGEPDHSAEEVEMHPDLPVDDAPAEVIKDSPLEAAAGGENIAEPARIDPRTEPSPAAGDAGSSDASNEFAESQKRDSETAAADTEPPSAPEDPPKSEQGAAATEPAEPVTVVEDGDMTDAPAEEGFPPVETVAEAVSVEPAEDIKAEDMSAEESSTEEPSTVETMEASKEEQVAPETSTAQREPSPESSDHLLDPTQETRGERPSSPQRAKDCKPKKKKKRKKKPSTTAVLLAGEDLALDVDSVHEVKDDPISIQLPPENDSTADVPQANPAQESTLIELPEGGAEGTPKADLAEATPSDAATGAPVSDIIAEVPGDEAVEQSTPEPAANPVNDTPDLAMPLEVCKGASTEDAEPESAEPEPEPEPAAEAEAASSTGNVPKEEETAAPEESGPEPVETTKNSATVESSEASQAEPSTAIIDVVEVVKQLQAADADPQEITDVFDKALSEVETPTGADPETPNDVPGGFPEDPETETAPADEAVDSPAPLGKEEMVTPLIENTPPIEADNGPDAAPEAEAGAESTARNPDPEEKANEIAGEQGDPAEIVDEVLADEGPPAEPQSEEVSADPTSVDEVVEVSVAAEVAEAEASGAVDDPAPPSSPDLTKIKSSRRRHYRTKERDRQISITNGHNALLERMKNEKGLFANFLAKAVYDAKDDERIRHKSDEYKEKQRRRKERREKRAAEEHKRMEEERETEREQERLAKEARREERRKRKEAEAEKEKAAKEAAAAAAAAAEVRRTEEEQKQRSAPPSPTVESKRRFRRSSFPASSSSSGGKSFRPDFIKRLTTGESETGGTLLRLKVNKALEDAPRSVPDDRGKGRAEDRDRTSGERRRHRRRHTEDGDKERREIEGKERDTDIQKRPTSSRHASSKSGSGGSRSTLANGLKAIFTY